MFAIDIDPKNIYIMKKFTTTIAFAAMFLLSATTTISAQENESLVGKFKVYEKVSYTISSPNGEWLGLSIPGLVTIYNTKTDETYKYIGNEENYYVIQTITDNGLATGSFNWQPAYWTKENEWTLLPLGEGELLGSGNAEQAFNEGSFIVGNIDKNLNGEKYWIPVIWYYNENSQTYDEPFILPYQEKDIIGLQAQGMYIRGGISEDGNRIFGRMIDRSGFNQYPTTWDKKEDNSWECNVHFVDQLINADAETPQKPVFDQTVPDPYDWMTDTEKDLFNKALEAFEDSMQTYFDTGDVNFIPKYDPNYSKQDFFNKDQDGTDRYNEYLAALEQYKEDVKNFNKLLEKYNIEYDKFFRDTTFSMTDIYMSDNGKYAIVKGIYSPDKTKSFTTPVLLDLENEEMHFIPVIFEDTYNDDSYSVGLTILDDGTVFHFAPVRGVNPETYVWRKGMKESIKIEEWIKSKSVQAYNEITERMTLNGKINLAFVVSHGKGNLLLGCSLRSDYKDLTWTADLAAYDDYLSVKDIQNKPSINIWPNPATDMIYINSEDMIEYMQLFDLEGKTIRNTYKNNSMNVSDLPSGLYILKVKAGNTIAIKKVSIN